jgi:hypothetical protein
LGNNTNLAAILLQDARNVCEELNQLKTNQKYKAMNPQEIENLKETHEKIKTILIEYGNEEFGDCIIDEICVAIGILPTSVYYNENN